VGGAEDLHLAQQSTHRTGDGPCASAHLKDIAQALRGHWAVENGIFRVRDVSYDEDRLHGRKIGRSLSSFRNVAINIIRHERYPFIPDGWRDIASRLGHGIYLLQHMRLIL
jgi:hypothetical protein